MKKNTIFLLIAILVIGGITTFFLTQKKEQTFAEAAEFPEDIHFVFHHLEIYKDLNGNLVEIKLTDEESVKLTELIITTKVAAKPVDYPPFPLLFVDQRVRDTQGVEYDYYIYNDAEDGNDYVFFHHLNEYYKINDTSIVDFYKEVLEIRLGKTSQ